MIRRAGATSIKLAFFEVYEVPSTECIDFEFLRPVARQAAADADPAKSVFTVGEVWNAAALDSGASWAGSATTHGPIPYGIANNCATWVARVLAGLRAVTLEYVGLLYCVAAVSVPLRGPKTKPVAVTLHSLTAAQVDFDRLDFDRLDRDCPSVFAERAFDNFARAGACDHRALVGPERTAPAIDIDDCPRPDARSRDARAPPGPAGGGGGGVGGGGGGAYGGASDGRGGGSGGSSGTGGGSSGTGDVSSGTGGGSSGTGGGGDGTGGGGDGKKVGEAVDAGASSKALAATRKTKFAAGVHGSKPVKGVKRTGPPASVKELKAAVKRDIKQVKPAKTAKNGPKPLVPVSDAGSKQVKPSQTAVTRALKKVQNGQQTADTNSSERSSKPSGSAKTPKKHASKPAANSKNADVSGKPARKAGRRASKTGTTEESSRAAPVVAPVA